MMDKKKALLKALPKIDESIGWLRGEVEEKLPGFIIKKSIQDVIRLAREQILEGNYANLPDSKSEWIERFRIEVQRKAEPRLRPVINGTGVVIHTNLGRSLLGEETARSLMQAAAQYTNLEFDLESGKRGSRYSLVEEILCEITGAESALVVNNNAAAVLIALDTLAKGKEVIVSRGQLVEIGGSFRIPDVMAKSGASMIEVGATNRTHIYDYENNINDETALLLRVHCSNFRIIGFTSEVSPVEMVALAKKHGIATMEDLGSGCLIDLSRFGFPKEPTVQEVVGAGVDVVTFSGDKLLGGPQAGIIVGSKNVISRIKKNPLNRALRIDKFTLAALESVLREYYDLEKALTRIPTLRMITASPEQLKMRAQNVCDKLQPLLPEDCQLSVNETTSRVGGGALPEFKIASWALVLDPGSMGVSRLEKQLRKLGQPLIGRIENDRFLLDMRTILDTQENSVVQSLSEVLKNA